MIEPKTPTFRQAKDLPEHIMALIVNMWERELGKIPEDNARIIYTYFDGIYTNQKLSEDIFIHEMVHFVRQGAGEDKDLADLWWRQYVSDKAFRYEEELLAYREQRKFMSKKLNRQQLFVYSKFLAEQLSSEKYGGMCSFNKALHNIINA